MSRAAMPAVWRAIRIASAYDRGFQAGYMRGAHMGIWTGVIVGGLLVAVLIKLGQWVGA